MSRYTTVTLLSIVIIIGFGIHTLLQPASQIEYHAQITDFEEQVYDGDTLADVHIKLLDIVVPPEDLSNRWPGVVFKADGVYAETRIRIAGIDTPERRPSKNRADKTPRSEAERDAEKAAAMRARRALIDLLKDADGLIMIENPEFGKYAQRIVAKLYVMGSDDVLTSVADYMITNGHAYEYDGGTRKEFPWTTD